MAVKADANMAAMVRVNFQYQRSDQLGEIAIIDTILFSYQIRAEQLFSDGDMADVTAKINSFTEDDILVLCQTMADQEESHHYSRNFARRLESR